MSRAPDFAHQLPVLRLQIEGAAAGPVVVVGEGAVGIQVGQDPVADHGDRGRVQSASGVGEHGFGFDALVVGDCRREFVHDLGDRCDVGAAGVSVSDGGRGGGQVWLEAFTGHRAHRADAFGGDAASAGLTDPEAGTVGVELMNRDVSGAPVDAAVGDFDVEGGVEHFGPAVGLFTGVEQPQQRVVGFGGQQRGRFGAQALFGRGLDRQQLRWRQISEKHGRIEHVRGVGRGGAIGRTRSCGVVVVRDAVDGHDAHLPRSAVPAGRTVSFGSSCVSDVTL